MKLLFLDIDGVLTSNETVINNNYLYTFSPKCVRNLNKILQTHSVKIILTSTWRTVFNIESQNEIFKENGVTQFPYDQTTNLSINNRSDEIKQYLNKRKVSSYAILDDMQIEGFNAQFVRTNPSTGLTMIDANKVIEILAD